MPAGRIISAALVHSGHPGDMESVVVDGRFVMRDREVLTMDRGTEDIFYPSDTTAGPSPLSSVSSTCRHWNFSPIPRT